MLARLIALLSLTVWLGGCASFYFKDAGLPPPASRHTLDQWPYSGYWTGIVFNGAKIGFSHLTLAPAADAPGQYEIHSDAAFVLHFLGLEKKFQLRARDRIHPDLTLASFEYDYLLDGSRQELRGRVADGALTVEIRTRGHSETRSFPLAAPVYPVNAAVLYPLLHGLAVGREFRYTVFDGELQKLAGIEQDVVAYETSELFQGPAFKLRTRLHGHTTDTWMNVRGEPVLEMALGGVLIMALEDEATARRYLTQASLNKQEVLLEFSRVPTDRAIPTPRTRRLLEVAFTGLDAARLPAADAGQRCEASGDETRCRMRRLVPPAAADSKPPAEAARYLRPTLSAPSSAPRIRDTAATIVPATAGDTEKITRLVDWIQNNIKREPVDVFSALDVLEGGKAECQGHAYLYAAFARSLGIPTRVVNGIVYLEEARGFLYHTWNESLVNNVWLPVDATLGQVGADATHVKLIEGESSAELLPLIDIIGRVKARVIGYE
jgi:hypothetical protein